jgi:hypothetical protein
MITRGVFPEDGDKGLQRRLDSNRDMRSLHPQLGCISTNQLALIAVQDTVALRPKALHIHDELIGRAAADDVEDGIGEEHCPIVIFLFHTSP